MRKKNKKKITTKITTADYIKAVKKADRELQLKQFPGWKRVTMVHKSKKMYDRKTDSKDYADE